MRREQRQRVRELRQQRDLLLDKLAYLDGQIAIQGAAAPFALVHDREQTEAELKAVEAEWDALLQAPAADFNPYVGLRTFEEKDAHLFFGRDALTAELVDKLRQWPFLAVMGPSGSGKSSVVRAGLIPELKGGALPGSEGWLYAIFKPGGRPLDALAVALAQLKGGESAEAVLSMRRLLAEDERGLLLAVDLLLGDGASRRLVLVVDQAEELVTLAPADKDARAAHEAAQTIPFVRQLLSAVSAVQTPLRLVITLRADFLHRVAEHPELARWIAEHDVIVSAMTPEELASAIYDPALAAGGEFEAGLAEELVEQVAGKPGALPLLEYTLSKLWEQRDGEGLMTWAAFKAMGGVEGALAARADAILHEKYGEDERQQLRHLLLRLIQPGEGALDSRRRALLDELTPAGRTPDEVQALLKPLVDERLLTTGRDPATGEETAEVSHEALIRAWPTLREWIENGREDLRFQLQVEEAAREWEASNASEDFLWSGLRLGNAEAWLARADPQLSERENLFLAASRAAAAQREEKAAAARREREALLEAKAEEARKRAEAERTNSRRLRIFAGVGAVLLALAVLTSLLAWGQKSLADRKTVEAVQAQQEAERQTELAQASENKAQEKAEEAVKAQKEAERQKRSAAAGELAAHAKTAIDEHPEDPDLAILLARRAMTTTLEDGYIHPQASDALMQAMAKAWPWRLVAGSEEGPLQEAQLSPTGELLLTTDRDGVSHIWDLRIGKEIEMPGGMEASTGFFNEDGALLATTGDEEIQIWDTQTWELRHRLKLPGADVSFWSGSFSPDNSRLATFDYSNSATLWDLRSEQTIISKAEIENGFAYFSSDDERLLLSDEFYSSFYLLNARTGDEIALEDAAELVVFSRFIGNLLIFSDNEVSDRIVNAETGRALNPFGAGVSLKKLDVSPDSNQVAVVSADGRALLLRSDSGAVQQRLRGRNIDEVWFSKTGKYLLVRESDGAARLLQTEGLQEVRTLAKIKEGRDSIDFAANDERLLIVDKEGAAWLHDLASDVEPREVYWEGADLVRFSANGSRMLVRSSFDVSIWDSDAQRALLILRDTTGAEPKFSPDGRYLRVGEKLWDVGAGDQLFSDIRSELEFSADGRFATDRTRVWDATPVQPLLKLGSGGDYNSISFHKGTGRIITEDKSDGSVSVWDATTGERVFSLGQLRFFGYSILESSNGAFIHYITFGGELWLWNISTGAKSELKFDTELDPWSDIESSAAGDFITFFTTDGKLHVWDIARKEDRFVIEVAKPEGDRSVSEESQSSISPDGRKIGFITEEGELRIVDSRDGTGIPLPAHIPAALDMGFSDDGSKIAVWDSEERLHIFDLSTGRRILDSKVTGAVSFSADGNYAIVGGGGWPNHLFDLRDGNELFADSPLGDLVAISPDGAFVALHDDQAQKLVVVDVESKQEIATFDVQDDLYDVAFSHDNRLLAVRDATGVDVWDIRDHRQLWQLGGESLGIFSPDGQYVLTGAHDSLRLRPSDPERLLTLSAPLIQRRQPALTPTELQNYGLD